MHQGLLDDGLVQKDKIGGSNYFYSFPGAEHRRVVASVDAAKDSLSSLKRKRLDLDASLAAAKVGREDEGGNRLERLKSLSSAKVRKASLEVEVATLAENDPAVILDLQKELRMCRDGAHRWTDNVFTCKAFLVKKKGVEPKEAEKYLGITSAFDYPEDKMPKAK